SAQLPIALTHDRAGASGILLHLLAHPVQILDRALGTEDRRPAHSTRCCQARQASFEVSRIPNPEGVGSGRQFRFRLLEPVNVIFQAVRDAAELALVKTESLENRIARNAVL